MKAELFAHCRDYITARVSRIKQNINSLRESLDSETRSSAGDKHETGRAMVQLEQEKLGQQLMEAEKSLQLLKSVDIAGKADRVHAGSLVYTTKAIYFMALSAAIFQQGDTRVYCISPESPIGKLLLGNLEGDSILFNKEKIKIVSIQ
jgi:transcription elongation GreA/GreB family factor